ncbi:MAG: hypothetical protein J07HX64_02708 [halophilic archaeon J07HX64]|nr:MAG: hypothetical protein J07HX64_02708 [halophilic archaeon J07HX64]
MTTGGRPPTPRDSDMTGGDTDTDTNMTDRTDDPDMYVAGDTNPMTDTEHHLGGVEVLTVPDAPACGSPSIHSGSAVTARGCRRRWVVQ